MEKDRPRVDKPTKKDNVKEAVKSTSADLLHSKKNPDKKEKT